MNPRETTDKIRSDYQNYIHSILSVKDKEIKDLAHKATRETEFVKGPFLESTLPFVDGKSLEELAEEGLVSKEFSVMGSSVHYSDWKLRIHQEKALRHIVEEDRNMVVSTGTGSGKTESYLYPIFNSLMREKEAGTLGPGVRALLIFPMNALANDQQKKLRKYLKTYPDITFGRYTGETEKKKKKETPEEAEKRMHEEYDIAHMTDTEEVYRKSIPNEMFCREMMAKNPPHILLTNYAMLEYMLLRPDTAPFFDNDSAKNWRFIVIDEAHTYKGANGTEIAYLLRRVKERIRHNMNGSFRCIATSATLGSEDGKADLAVFAQRLFDEPFSAEDIITTKRKEREILPDSRYFDLDDYKKFKADIANMTEAERGRYLHRVLSKDLRLFGVYKALKNKPDKVESVADSVFGDLSSLKEREEALVLLIELAAAAKLSESESALLPARYHLFIKSLEGMFAQYYPSKKVFLDRKEQIWNGDKSYSVFELANCQKCEQEYLVGKTRVTSNGNYFVQSSSDDKPEYYFISDVEEIGLTEFDEDDSIEESFKLDKLGKFKLCLACGRITPFAEKHPSDCCSVSDSKKIVTVFSLDYRGKYSESNCCPCCGATHKGLIKKFLTANQPATFAVAKSLYDAIPPRPLEQKKTDDIFDDDIFGDDTETTVSTQLNDESGRKLLIFSDNRQEAAFFAGFFEKKYNLIMWRKLILECLKEAPDNTLFVGDLVKRVRNAADKAGIYTLDYDRGDYLTDDQKLDLAAHYVMQEFISPDIQTGLEGLGYIQVFPEIQKLSDSVEVAGLKGVELWNLLRFMMDTLRQKCATNFPESIRATDDFFAPRNHTGYFRMSGSSSDRYGYTYGFIPADKSPNKRLAIMMKLLEDEDLTPEAKDAKARENLKAVYELLCKLKAKNYVSDSNDSGNGTVYQLNHAKWKFRCVKPNEKLYCCNKCGKSYGYSLKGLCPEMKCDGLLEEVEASSVQSEPYYSGIFSDSKLIPMVSREHTAQLSSKTAGKYQKDFEEGRINVLSCSTTFEMGVDVGELEATFQRNVPPETANYIQRAGRAGRRTSSAAFSVTFSRRSSHDMTFFRDPAQIIAGKIAPPVLEIDNEKIAERHLNSIVISWFFKKHPEYFNGNTQKIVSLGETKNMATELKEELNQHPEDLLKSIYDVIPADVCESIGVGEWAFIDDISGEEGTLARAIVERASDIEGLKKFSNDVMTHQDDKGIRKLLGRAISAQKLITTLEEEKSINFLSAKGVLPKYGFPIDTVKLDILGGNEEEAKKIDLSRDLKMAISEFAPPAKIVANGKIWESYAINTIPDKGWPAYIYNECPKCKKIHHPDENMVDVNVDLEECPKKMCDYCHTKMDTRLFIIPLFGFSTQMGYKPKSVGDSRPSTYYATQTQFWGIENLTEKQKSEAMEDTLDFKGKKVPITYSPGGKLFVLNQGSNGRGLHVCPNCGFAKDPAKLLKGNKHETKFGKICASRNLVKVSLGHEFSTDIMKIALPSHDSDIKMPDGVQPKNQYLSVLYAILEGASKALDISRDDISGCITEKQELVLFDDTAGGSGFVKHIYQNFKKVLREARNKVSGGCGCTEETSCYGCLRNYSNQFFHDDISRGMAREYIDWLLNCEVEVSNEPVKTPVAKDNTEVIGVKKLVYDAPDTSSNPDTLTKLEELFTLAEDDTLKIAINKLVNSTQNGQFENPITFNCLPAVEGSVWPIMFWPSSKVALFDVDSKPQYDVLRKYDWYCYLLDDNLDPDLVVSHIKKEG